MSTPFDETDARFSPDGRWIAHKSNETGRTGIYAATFVTEPRGQSEKPTCFWPDSNDLSAILTAATAMSII